MEAEDTAAASGADIKLPKEPPFFTNFLQRYCPAERVKDATILLSTAEVQEQILQHSGVIKGAAELYQWLWDKGFRDTDIGDLNFRWMMKELE